MDAPKPGLRHKWNGYVLTIAYDDDIDDYDFCGDKYDWLVEQIDDIELKTTYSRNRSCIEEGFGHIDGRNAHVYVCTEFYHSIEYVVEFDVEDSAEWSGVV